VAHGREAHLQEFCQQQKQSCSESELREQKRRNDDALSFLQKRRRQEKLSLSLLDWCVPAKGQRIEKQKRRKKR
jgi:hypothetical protein